MNMLKYIKYMFFFSVITLYSCGIDEDFPTQGLDENALNLNIIIPFSQIGASSTRTDVSASALENYVKDCDIEIYKDDILLCSFSNVTATKLLNDSTYSFSIVLESREEEPDPAALKAKFKDAEIRVYANNGSYPSVDSPLKTRPESPFYMSGHSTISLTNNVLEADIHLVRGVAKVRTVIRTTQRSQMGDWVIDYDKITYNMIRVAPAIRRLAPFDFHNNLAVTSDLAIDEYVNYDAAPQTDWTAADGKYKDLASQVVLQDKTEEGVSFDSTYLSCDQYVLENWLNDETQYDVETNVTAMETTIQLHNTATNEVKTITRFVPITIDGSYHLMRNYIYTIDIQVLSPQDFDVYLDLSIGNIELPSNILGDNIEFDRDKITIINQGISYYTDGYHALTFILQQVPIKGDSLRFAFLDENKEVFADRSGFNFDISTDKNLSAVNSRLGKTESVMYGVSAVPAYGKCTARLSITLDSKYFDSTTKKPIGPVPHYFRISYEGIDHIIPVEIASDPVPLDKEGTANCYIVEKPGIYSFNGKLVGNGIDGVTNDVSFQTGGSSDNTYKITKANYNTIKSSTYYGPSIIFQDENDLIDQVVYDMSTDRIIFSISGSQPGNASIALSKNVLRGTGLKSASTYWRWHIWYGPRPNDKYVKSTDSSIGYYAFMDRFIGASSENDLSHVTYYQYGNPMPYFNFIEYPLYYSCRNELYTDDQWGRKYSDISSSYSSYANYPANKRVGMILNYYMSTGDEDVDPESPFWGIPYSENPNPVSQQKTIYDPCPFGYRVPSLQAYKDLIADETVGFSGDNGGTSTNPNYFEFTNLPFNQGDLKFLSHGKITSTTTVDHSKIQSWTTGIFLDGSTKKRAIISYAYGTDRAGLISGSSDGALLPVRCVKE